MKKLIPLLLITAALFACSGKGAATNDGSAPTAEETAQTFDVDMTQFDEMLFAYYPARPYDDFVYWAYENRIYQCSSDMTKGRIFYEADGDILIEKIYDNKIYIGDYKDSYYTSDTQPENLFTSNPAVLDIETGEYKLFDTDENFRIIAKANDKIILLKAPESMFSYCPIYIADADGSNLTDTGEASRNPTGSNTYVKDGLFYFVNPKEWSCYALNPDTLESTRFIDDAQYIEYNGYYSTENGIAFANANYYNNDGTLVEENKQTDIHTQVISNTGEMYFVNYPSLPGNGHTCAISKFDESTGEYVELTDLGLNIAGIICINNNTVYYTKNDKWLSAELS